MISGGGMGKKEKVMTLDNYIPFQFYLSYSALICGMKQ